MLKLVSDNENSIPEIRYVSGIEITFTNDMEVTYTNLPTSLHEAVLQKNEFDYSLQNPNQSGQIILSMDSDNSDYGLGHEESAAKILKEQYEKNLRKSKPALEQDILENSVDKMVNNSINKNNIFISVATVKIMESFIKVYTEE